MAYKNTVAIIGAASPLGALAAKKIASSYRLLLMDVSLSQLASLQQQITKADKEAETDVLSCCKDASWEADIVVVAVAHEKLAEVAANIKEVTTCKTVIHFLDKTSQKDTLQQLLPHAQVVAVDIEHNEGRTGIENAFLYGENEAAVAIAKNIVTLIGCEANKA